MKKKYLVLAIICLANFLACFAQYQTSVLSTQLVDSFDMSNMQFSALTTAQMVPTIFLSLFIGVFLDKVGIRKGILISLIISTISMFLKINVTSYIGLFILCMMTGIFGASFNVANPKAVNLFFEPKEVGVAMGIIQAFLALGQLISLALCGNLPYKTTFIITSIIGIICVVLWFLFVKIDKESKQTGKVDLLAALKYKDAILIGAVLFCLFGGLGVITSFLPSKLLSDNYSTTQAGLITSICAASRLIGALTLPSLLKKSNNALQYGILAIFGLSVLSLAFIHNYIIIAILVFIAGFVVGGFAPILFGKPIAIKNIKQENVAAVSGLVSLLQILGAVAVPSYICAPIANGNYFVLYLIGGIIASGALILYIPLKKKGI